LWFLVALAGMAQSQAKPATGNLSLIKDAAQSIAAGQHRMILARST
jgi:hypothetical protein